MSVDVLNLDLERIIRLIPGYDPFSQAGQCWFDADAAQFAIQFVEECCSHVKGPKGGERLVLEPWEKAIFANLWGWKRPNGTRRYREALIYIPRGNAKTTLAAAAINLVLFTENEAGAELYSSAAEREQARLCFDTVAGMIRQEPELEQRAELFKYSINVEDRVYKALSAEAGSKHGFNVHLLVNDELHAHKTPELTDVLLTGMGKRSQPLAIHLTTADYEREGSICNQKHDYAKRVRDNSIDPGVGTNDPAFLPVIYEASKDDDWTDPRVWAKANPNLGVSIPLEYIERECAKARDSSAYLNTFLRLHLNVRTQSDVRWLTLEKWDACPTDADPSTLAGFPCFGGLDLSTTTDISAFVLAFPRAGGGYSLLCRFWVPEDNAHAREKKDRVPYSQWIREGWIKATPGNVIDYDVIRADIVALSKQYQIKEIAADRWNATQIITQLTGDGLSIVAYGQGFKDMTAPTKELEALVVSGKLDHGGNPVLRWMASNVTVEQDAAGNLKPSKAKSTERIDGIVAAIMAIGRAMVTPAAQRSYYEDNDMEWMA